MKRFNHLREARRKLCFFLDEHTKLDGFVMCTVNEWPQGKPDLVKTDHDDDGSEDTNGGQGPVLTGFTPLKGEVFWHV